MLCKFESRSQRVKGLSFHPTRHWILAALHTGVVQLWDYRRGVMLDKFEDHDCPVRGVAFHPTQPLFATGADDFKVKIWNFKTKRVVFVLEGHLDYVRTVCFHHELPWLMSSSDDQTIRIWNWQSRQCLAILTGHNHYIMSAQFHPKEDLIVSASLDQTVRVWNFKSLRQKFYSAGSSGRDLLPGIEVTVKYVLEGHDRGVNWAEFHPRSPYIISSADDRTVRLWRYTDDRAWEVDILRGHGSNVSCAIFHPLLEVIISDSEDKTIRIWDMARRNTVHTHRKENDRFWILAAHPAYNLIAAGYDSGFLVFKLEKERIVGASFKNSIVYVHDKNIYMVDEKGRDKTLCTLTPPTKTLVYQNNPSAIFVNNFVTKDLQILIQYDQDGGSYFYLNIPNDKLNSNMTDTKITPQQGTAVSCCFVGRERFAILKKNQEIHLMDTTNSMKKKIQLGSPLNIFTSGVSKILAKYKDVIKLYDTNTLEQKAELECTDVKRVVWSPNMEYVAMLLSRSKIYIEIIICNKNLQIVVQTDNEKLSIKSGAWDPCGVFLYSTVNHVKYLVLNG